MSETPSVGSVCSKCGKRRASVTIYDCWVCRTCAGILKRGVDQLAKKLKGGFPR